MGTAWFKRWGWWQRPLSALGWLATLAALAFSVNVFIALDRHAHSVSDTLYGVFPYFACAFLLLDWLARRHGLMAGDDRAKDRLAEDQP